MVIKWVTALCQDSVPQDSVSQQCVVRVSRHYMTRLNGSWHFVKTVRQDTVRQDSVYRQCVQTVCRVCLKTLHDRTEWVTQLCQESVSRAAFCQDSVTHSSVRHDLLLPVALFVT